MIGDEKSGQLKEVLEKYKSEGRNALITVLQGAQDIYGYLPAEVLETISRGLKVPLSAVYGVATFYAQFHMKPRGRNIIKVCQGTACHVRGGKKILETLRQELKINEGETTPDLKFTLETVFCLGTCFLAPVMMINNNYYGHLVSQKIKGILSLKDRPS